MRVSHAVFPKGKQRGSLAWTEIDLGLRGASTRVLRGKPFKVRRNSAAKAPSTARWSADRTKVSGQDRADDQRIAFEPRALLGGSNT